MNLKDYLSNASSLSIVQLAAAIGLNGDNQLRQWLHGYQNRKPGPVYCVAIERATNGTVTRQDLRPDDWMDIWPELAATEQ